MYRCDNCETVVGPRIPCNIVVVETKMKDHPARPSVGDPGGRGTQIVKENKLCPECAEGY